MRPNLVSRADRLHDYRSVMQECESATAMNVQQIDTKVEKVQVDLRFDKRGLAQMNQRCAVTLASAL